MIIILKYHLNINILNFINDNDKKKLYAKSKFQIVSLMYNFLVLWKNSTIEK